MRFDNEDDKIVGDWSVRQLEGIVRRLQKYLAEGSLIYSPGSWSKNIAVWSGGDTDGFPYEETIFVLKRENEQEIWKIGIGYESTDGDAYDYAKEVRADRNTAYKVRTPGPPKTIKFKLRNYWLSPQKGNILDLACAEISELNSFFSDIDAKTSTIESWAKSGLGMRIFCTGCWRLTDIMSKTLYNYAAVGHSLFSLESRFTCSKCGKHNPLLRPLPPD